MLTSQRIFCWCDVWCVCVSSWRTVWTGYTWPPKKDTSKWSWSCCTPASSWKQPPRYTVRISHWRDGSIINYQYSNNQCVWCQSEASWQTFYIQTFWLLWTLWNGCRLVEFRHKNVRLCYCNHCSITRVTGGASVQLKFSALTKNLNVFKPPELEFLKSFI